MKKNSPAILAALEKIASIVHRPQPHAALPSIPADGRGGFTATSQKILLCASSSASDQRQRLLAQLRIAPADTIALRSELDILMPAARVHELKQRGYDIQTAWVKRATDCGKIHRIALYTLNGGV